jgi:glutamate-ammonia-ligase adenylyltransferase
MFSDKTETGDNDIELQSSNECADPDNREAMVARFPRWALTIRKRPPSA